MPYTMQTISPLLYLSGVPFFYLLGLCVWACVRELNGGGPALLLYIPFLIVFYILILYDPYLIALYSTPPPPPTSSSREPT